MPNFYTYLYLREDGSPYYVGKGKGNRAFVSHIGHRPPKNRSRIIVQPWPDEATAFAYEIYQIDFWGRKDLGTGILRNQTEGGQGPSGHVATEAERRAGRVNGRRAVENGNWEKVRRLGSIAGGRIVGKIQGPKNVENGHLVRMREIGRTTGAMARSGHIQGIKNAKNGTLALGRHNRWHQWRDIVNPDCELCQKEMQK
jgi:hypothetical protein